MKMRWQTIASNVSIRTISPTATPLPKAYDCVAVYIAGRRTSLVVYGCQPKIKHINSIWYLALITCLWQVFSVARSHIHTKRSWFYFKLEARLKLYELWPQPSWLAWLVPLAACGPGPHCRVTLSPQVEAQTRGVWSKRNRALPCLCPGQKLIRCAPRLNVTAPGGGGLLPIWWVIHMCRGFDPLFLPSGYQTRSFWGVFSHPPTQKQSFGYKSSQNSIFLAPKYHFSLDLFGSNFQWPAAHPQQFSDRKPMISQLTVIYIQIWGRFSNKLVLKKYFDRQFGKYYLQQYFHIFFNLKKFGLSLTRNP